MADLAISDDAVAEFIRSAEFASSDDDLGLSPRAIRAGLRAAIAQYLTEQDERRNGCCRMGICRYDRDCPGYATCTLEPVEEDR